VARRHGIPAVMVSHESVTALLKAGPVSPGRLRSAFSRTVADWLNRRTARAYQQVICTTAWAAAEFERIGSTNLARVPLGVTWPRSAPAPGAVRARYAGAGQTLLVHAAGGCRRRRSRSGP